MRTRCCAWWGRAASCSSTPLPGWLSRLSAPSREILTVLLYPTSGTSDHKVMAGVCQHCGIILMTRQHLCHHRRPLQHRLRPGLPGQSLPVRAGPRHQHQPVPAVPSVRLHPRAESDKWPGRHWNLSTQLLRQRGSDKWDLLSRHEWDVAKVN